MTFEIHHGDCLDVMAAMPENSVDTIITDPPYGLSFMGKDWDHGIPGERFWREALRVAKPGAILMAFGGTRTWHRLACAIEDAGWELRDTMMYLYGSGFPKSHDISKAIDKAAGAERNHAQHTRADTGFRFQSGGTPSQPPATPLAAQWDGWGTALKPAWEPILVAMKPRDGTFAENAEKWGVAGLNIDGGRIGTEDETGRLNRKGPYTSERTWSVSKTPPQDSTGHGKGRWPANLLLDEEAAAMLDEQSGERGASAPVKGNEPSTPATNVYNGGYGRQAGTFFGDSGGASRFFYTAKASRAERDAGLGEDMPLMEAPGSKRSTPAPGRESALGQPRRNGHPCVKPIALMRYLCRLTKTPTGGVVLDPFMGSGSTGCAAVQEGRSFVGIELDAEYCEIARRRIEHWAKQPTLM